jgi:hypothetical protein
MNHCELGDGRADIGSGINNAVVLVNFKMHMRAGGATRIAQ